MTLILTAGRRLLDRHLLRRLDTAYQTIEELSSELEALENDRDALIHELEAERERALATCVYCGENVDAP